MNYVYQCIKSQGAISLGLGSKKYRKGDYISYDGEPVRNIENAYIFKKGEYGFDDHDDFNMNDYFALVAVKIIPVESIK